MVCLKLLAVSKTNSFDANYIWKKVIKVLGFNVAASDKIMAQAYYRTTS